MIILPKTALCQNCANNPQVYQPSTDRETEWLMCDKYNPVPVEILKGKEDCKEFNERGQTNVLQT